tara:strand:- start:443 stop:550 length:108 start_codon:yes stop_codon:yes gene_type:complete
LAKAAKTDFMLVVTDWHDMLQTAERHFLIYFSMDD